ncbi:gluconokinase [Haloferula luteola]|uniref:Gluconokinase n=1 Tax=Haloferula luteola TaxID=595692 RepID=A0A840V6V7_9BACT|nr:DUF5069 domain-containing protein [Haloferula luteola]MBB5353755.1 gluconokinase [Haloferula luteola]
MPTTIPGLRSPSETVGELVYFGRMLDKIRLHAAGQLPPDWVVALGNAYPTTFDSRTCRFLGIDYDALTAQTLKGGTDEDILAWAFEVGRRPSNEELEMWNAFLLKRGWRDSGTPTLHQRLADAGLPPGTVETMFEFLDLDEGRLEL